MNLMNELTWPEAVIAYGRWLKDPDNWPIVQKKLEVQSRVEWYDHLGRCGIEKSRNVLAWRLKPHQIKFRVISDDRKKFKDSLLIQIWDSCSDDPPYMVPGHSAVTDWIEEP